MIVEAQETEILETEAPTAADKYPAGGEVSAITLIQDVRAIRQRLDGVEMALRRLGTRMEELSPGPKGSVVAAGPSADSLEELRNALLADLQTGLHQHTKRGNLMMGAILLTVLVGLGSLGWMIHRLE